MTVSATVLYPAEADATFDMKYYLSTHSESIYAYRVPMSRLDSGHAAKDMLAS